MSITGNPISIHSGAIHLSWHQCPEKARKFLDYLAEHPYSVNDYTYTCVNNPTYGAPTQSEVNTMNQTVKNFYTTPLKCIFNGVSINGTENLEPLKPASFIVNGQTVVVTPLDKIRWYNTTYAPPATGSSYSRGQNTRDLGGWSCDGGTIKYGKLIRGSEPNPADRDLLVNQIGIKTEVQLLPIHEQSTDYKMKSPLGVDWAGNTTEGSTYGGTENPLLQRKILKDIFHSIAADKPVYFHCGIGADRTGAIAILLEALLGVSINEIEQDFELTNFFNGYQSLAGGIYRSRVYSTWNLVNAFNNVQLLSGFEDTFHNRVISWVASLGITADELNAFRAACIDGTPNTISYSLPSYAISQSGSHTFYSNSISSIVANDNYEIELIPEIGYLFDDISVKLNGVDITDTAVIEMEKENYYHTVQHNLTSCNITNEKTNAIRGEGFVEDIICSGDFTEFKNFSNITVTMGGVDITEDVVVFTDDTETAQSDYFIIYTLNNSSSSNTQSTIATYASYTTIITPDTNYAVSNIQVTMNGIDISSTAVSGNTISINSVTGRVVITVTTISTLSTYSINYNLSNTTSSNTDTSILEGSNYSTTITPNSGYNIDSVTVLMGGNTVANAYDSTNNTISITNVTGNISITVTTATTSLYTNLADPSSSDWKTNTRLSSSAGGNYESTQQGCVVTNLIPYTSGDVIHIYGFGAMSSTEASWSRDGVYTSNDTSVAPVALGYPAADNNWHYYSYDSATGIVTMTMRDKVTANYYRIGCKPLVSADQIIITRNEPIVF